MPKVDSKRERTEDQMSQRKGEREIQRERERDRNTEREREREREREKTHRYRDIIGLDPVADFPPATFPLPPPD